MFVDTLSFSKSLEKGGFTKEQSETLVKQLSDSENNKLATKQDLIETKSSLDKKISELKFDMVKWAFGLCITILISQFGLAITLIKFLNP